MKKINIYDMKSYQEVSNDAAKNYIKERLEINSKYSSSNTITNKDLEIAIKESFNNFHKNIRESKLNLILN